MTEFVTLGFDVPSVVRINDYIIRPLTLDHLTLDLEAVNSSVRLIRRTRGGSWPTKAITLEEDRTDLAAHQKEFEDRVAFAYTILTKDEKRCAGSIYVNPPYHPLDDTDRTHVPSNADAVVSFWVSQQDYDLGLYAELCQFIPIWLRDSWPFQNPFISNVLLDI